MNLTTDPWLPAVSADGQSVSLSLRDAFARAHEIRDLALRPHERIAVMRLLLCITHAALDGPANRKEWRACRDRIAPAVEKYLARPEIAKAFNLFGDKQRFLQLLDLEPMHSGNKKTSKHDDDEEGGSMASKLDISLASGINHTLFDHGGGSDRTFGFTALALSLLTFQNFSGESPFGVALWAKQETRSTANQPAKSGKTYASAGPMLQDGALHTFIIGGSLLDTLHLNLHAKDGILEKMPATSGDNWGKPVWEQMPSGWHETKIIEQATEAYLGRLAPISRAIRLLDDRRTALISNGFSYPNYPEPTLTMQAKRTKKGEDKRYPLQGETSRALWRMLPSFLVKRRAGLGGPLALDNLDEGRSFDLWVGAVVPANKNKIEDVIESVFSFPRGLPGDEETANALEVYSKGVDAAEQMERCLRQAVRLFRVGVERVRKESAQDFEQAVRQSVSSLKGAEKARVDGFAASAAATFWTQIDQQSGELKDHAFDRVDIDWNALIGSAAHRAYELSCPRETARQMQAFVIGLKQLSQPKPEAANS